MSKGESQDFLREIRKANLVAETFRVMNLPKKERLIYDIDQAKISAVNAKKIIERIENTPESERTKYQLDELPIAINTLTSSIKYQNELERELAELLTDG